MIRSYQRQATIQASHFNGAGQYELLNNMQASTEPVPTSLWMELLSKIHGHNFRITIAVKAEPVEGQRYLVLDEDLLALILQWDNCNLSIHPDFMGGRATTELMAEVLVRKVRALVPKGAIAVEVWETDQIMAKVQEDR